MADAVPAPIADGTKPTTGTHWWQSTGTTAFLSAVVGGAIAFSASYSVKSREIENERIDARVERIRQAALEANDALASMQKANEERYLLATGQMRQIDNAQRVSIAR